MYNILASAECRIVKEEFGLRWKIYNADVFTKLSVQVTTLTEQLKKILGEGPYPFPLDNFANAVCIHSNDNLLVMQTKTLIPMPSGSHAHNSYEFLIPLTPMPSCKVEKRLIDFNTNKIFSFDSGQFHGPSKTLAGCRFMGFQVEKPYFLETANMVFGREIRDFQTGGFELDSEVLHLIRCFSEEDTHRRAGYEFILDTITIQIVIRMLRLLKGNLPEEKSEPRVAVKNNIKRVMEFFRENYDSEYSLTDAAQIANLSPYHFIRVFKKHVGQTPYEYLLDIKIEKAIMLLKDRDNTITDICYLCGFSNLNHFTSVFKRKVGVSPSYYRKNVLFIFN